MAEQAESDYTELIKKKDKMLSDKDKIHTQIEKLDTLKNNTLKTTYDAVNEAFSNIFTTLLPGAKAHLELVDQQNI